MDSITKVNERNFGIDLLRILAMYMVVVLHVLGQGGILDSCEKYSVNYYSAWFLETSVFCAVDVFAMITGYVMVDTKFNGFKMILLWLVVFFYSLIITVLFRFVPSLKLLHEVSKIELIKSFFPVVSHQYWYFSAYFGMYFFIPFINKLSQNLEKKEYAVLCITIIVIYSLLPLLCMRRIDSFNIGGGIQLYG